MDLASILIQIPDWIELIAIFVLALCVLATVVARVTPSKADDEAVGRFTAMILKAVAFAPTFGMNPRTKQLEETIKMLKEEQAKAQLLVDVVANAEKQDS
jgi:hypothetical protein